MLLANHKCRKGMKNSMNNCLYQCIPTFADGNRNLDLYISIITSWKNKYKTLTKTEREEYLLSKVRESITGQTGGTGRKNKKSKTSDSNNNNNSSSSSSSSSSSNVDSCCVSSSNSYCGTIDTHNENEYCTPCSQNDNGIPCFKSNTVVDETNTNCKSKLIQKYTFPTYEASDSSNGFAISSTSTFSNRECCRECFAFLYDFTVYEIEIACACLKINPNATSLPPKSYKDKTLHPYVYGESHIIFSHNLAHEQFNSGDRPFDDNMISNSLLPANDSDINLSLWLEDCFLSYGDSASNRNVSFVASTFKKDIWELYNKEMKRLQKKPVDESRFNEVWLACYPNFLVRPYANVVGKCDTCYKIDYQRRSATDKQTKEALRQAHLMHRGGMFMLERRG